MCTRMLFLLFVSAIDTVNKYCLLIYLLTFMIGDCQFSVTVTFSRVLRIQQP